MRRLANEKLITWYQQAQRVPLLIRGARQVGKTWLVRNFAQQLNSFVEINLEATPEYHALFKDLFGKPHELVKALSLLSGKKITAGETLLFLDEIQESKEALLALRYFKEQMPELHVIAAGSLLEFTIKELSFPVGRIDFFHLFPLNFQEYLMAIDRNDLIMAIEQANAKQTLPQTLHESLLAIVTSYCLTGGMPEVIQTYLETNDLQACQAIQQRLAVNFREDFYKYASRSKIDYLRMLFEGLPRLFGQKFKYSNINQTARSRDLDPALNLLIDAGLGYKAFHSSCQGLPLGSQIKPNKFKVFSLDIGIAQRVLGLNLAKLFLEKNYYLGNRGAIAEQFVAQELVSYTPQNNLPQLYYWHREAKSSKAEVDFVMAHDHSILPIEVKSGTRQSTKSLNLFLKSHAEHTAQGLKISSENFKTNGIIKTIPFYAIFQLFRSTTHA